MRFNFTILNNEDKYQLRQEETPNKFKAIDEYFNFHPSNKSWLKDLSYMLFCQNFNLIEISLLLIDKFTIYKLSLKYN